MNLMEHDRVSGNTARVAGQYPLLCSILAMPSTAWRATHGSDGCETRDNSCGTAPCDDSGSGASATQLS